MESAQQSNWPTVHEPAAQRSSSSAALGSRRLYAEMIINAINCDT